MEKFILQEDMHIACLKAISFPEGIPGVHEKIGRLAGPDNEQTVFGISYLYDDNILYLAGFETSSGEEAKKRTGLSFILKKGTYICIMIRDYPKDISSIEKAFKQLLDDPGIDPNGCCVEWYFPKGNNSNTANDVRCMVRLAD